ncbi:MAG: response regulator [Proteobacteria bacterium]|nr:response regulator [Pseudomonadota bacterium]MBU1418078.1 response regulator [Pseudomonadota bacterium]MBU1454842.1 response regulator [Pseudomonadota bacterium]
MKINILIVDDERDFAKMLSERFELKGFSTAVVYDGFNALSWLDENSCEIILLDLGLPGMNGIDVLPRIREAHPFVQVVILTAASDVNIAIATMKHGATDYLIKPVAFDTLLAVIH